MMGWFLAPCDTSLAMTAEQSARTAVPVPAAEELCSFERETKSDFTSKTPVQPAWLIGTDLVLISALT